MMTEDSKYTKRRYTRRLWKQHKRQVGFYPTSEIKLLPKESYYQAYFTARSYMLPLYIPALEYWVASTIPIKSDVVRHIKRAQRLMALRIIRVYKTVYKSSTIIASRPNILLLENKRASYYSQLVKQRKMQRARDPLLQYSQRQVDNTGKADGYTNWSRTWRNEWTEDMATSITL